MDIFSGEATLSFSFLLPFPTERVNEISVIFTQTLNISEIPVTTIRSLNSQ